MQFSSDEKTCLARKEFCNFESKDLCLWKQDRDRDDFDWIIHNGKTPSNQTGPLMDHTKLTVNGKLDLAQLELSIYTII